MTDALLLLIALVAGIAGGATAAFVVVAYRKPTATPVPPTATPAPAPIPRPVHPDRIEVLLCDAEQASRRLDRLIRRAELHDPAHDSSLSGVSTTDIESDPVEVAVREGLSQGESAESLAEALGVAQGEIDEIVLRLGDRASPNDSTNA